MYRLLAMMQTALVGMRCWMTHHAWRSTAWVSWRTPRRCWRLCCLPTTLAAPGRAAVRVDVVRKAHHTARGPWHWEPAGEVRCVSAAVCEVELMCEVQLCTHTSHNHSCTLHIVPHTLVAPHVRCNV